MALRDVRRCVLLGVALGAAFSGCVFIDPDDQPADHQPDGSDGLDSGGCASGTPPDADCDGIAAADDCDDEDASVGARASDADCDGIPTREDCDDNNEQMPINDEDCDGILTRDDCDDTDPTSTTRTADADCDGVLTEDDCNDTDAAMPIGDADCDGVPADEDCDDNTPDLGATALDGDCDGTPTGDDCDDTDPASTTVATDADCDGVRTEADCDDADGTVPIADDLDCDDVPVHAGGGALYRIAAQTFDMGCTEGQLSLCEPEEEPARTVTLSNDFFIGVTEVTQAEFLAVMGYDPSYLGFGSVGSARSDPPVDTVAWSEAAAFTNELSRSAGLTECYDCTGSSGSFVCSHSTPPYACDGYRLPTEAEWEAAARCNTDLRWSGSDRAEGYVICNNCGTSPISPSSVATQSANGCGLYDLSGNVEEWVHDYWDGSDYSSAATVDPEGPQTPWVSSTYGTMHGLRGGHWRNSTIGCRVTYRVGSGYRFRDYYTGFRVARTAP